MDSFGVDGRDVALIIALCAIAAGLLLWRGIRPSTIGFLRAVFAPAIVTRVVLLAAYGFGIVAVARHFGFWDASLTKATVYWFVTVFLAGAARSSDVAKGERPFRSLVTPPVTVGVIVPFVSGLFTFSWWIELIILVALVVAGLIAGAALVLPGPGTGCLIKASNVIIVAASLAILGRVFLGLVGQWAGIDWATIGREFALPLLFTAAAAPALYALVLDFYRDHARKGLRRNGPARSPDWRSGMALVLESRGRISLLSRITPECLDSIARATSLAEARTTCRSCVAGGGH